MTQRIEISSRTIIFTVIFLLSLQLLWMIREIIFALFLAFILMSALKPVVKTLMRYGLKRNLAAFLVFITTVIIFGFMLAFILPPVITEAINFITNLPYLFQNSMPFLTDYLKLESLIRFLPDITQNIFHVATGLFSNLLFVVSILFFTFYFLLEERFLQTFIRRFLDDKDADRFIKTTEKIELRMGAWVRGELLLMTAIGVVTYIGLSILGFRYALALAFIAGLFEVIPIIGPIISAIPAMVVGLSISPVMAGMTAILYTIIQQLENNVIVPYVMNKAVGLHPVTTLIALSIGGKLGGLLGALLAVPVALVVESVVGELLKDHKI